MSIGARTRPGGQLVLALGIFLCAVMLPVQACSGVDSVTINNRQARDLRVSLGTGEYLGVAHACSTARRNTYFDQRQRGPLVVRVSDQADQEVLTVQEPLGSATFTGNYHVTVEVPERQAGECGLLEAATITRPID